MPQPTQSDVHVDAVLTNISIAYAQDESKFVASKVFPIVPVGKQSDKYFKYTKNDWFVTKLCVVRKPPNRLAAGTRLAWLHG